MAPPPGSAPGRWRLRRSLGVRRCLPRTKSVTTPLKRKLSFRVCTHAAARAHAHEMLTNFHNFFHVWYRSPTPNEEHPLLYSDNSNPNSANLMIFTDLFYFVFVEHIFNFSNERYIFYLKKFLQIIRKITQPEVEITKFVTGSQQALSRFNTPTSNTDHQGHLTNEMPDTTSPSQSLAS